jgi:hypothetical protein
MHYVHSPKRGRLLRVCAALALVSGAAFTMPAIRATAASPSTVEVSIDKFA